MARLPLPGADSNVWGDVLNDFLLQAHKPDGSLKNGIVTSSTIAPNSITAAVIEDGAISSTKLSASTGVDGQVLTLNSSQAGGLDWTSPNAGTAALGGDLSGTLGNAQIISGAVTTAKLLDASVTDAKIAGNISQSKISGLTTDLSAKVDASTLGAANGVATLDSGGKVPSSQLPPPASGGESNTASNVGTSGVGIYLQKTGVDLEFKKLCAGSNKVTLTDEIATNTVAVDIDTVNLGLDKTSVGLGNVDNTSDANKPISTATQTVLDTKANTSSLATVAITGSYADLVSKPTIPNIVASATAPVSPAVGDMWVDTSG